MRGTLLATTLGLLLLATVAAGPAAAEVPPCEGTHSQRTLYRDQGTMEAVIVGNSGRLFTSVASSDGTASELRGYSRPGADPVRVSIAGPGPGGLAWSGHHLLWGNGNTAANGSVGDETPKARLLRVNVGTGLLTILSDYLGMANGVVRAGNGAIYASNDFGTKIDRVSRRGVTRNGWASVDSPNGMVISRNGRYLFANQTFVTPSAISRIEIADPGNVKTWATAEGLVPSNVILDGLTRDNKGSLYAAAWAAGEIWKIDPDRRICVLATGIDRPSSLAFGGGKGRFRSARLYAVGFGGEIVQVKGARRATVPGQAGAGRA